ncbi:MAG: hypothetical protein U0840_30000 [Gemmataceae bacterium]
MAPQEDLWATPESKIEVRLSADQRAALQRLVWTGNYPARIRAAILLLVDAAGSDHWTNDWIAMTLDINRITLTRLRLVRRKGPQGQSAQEGGRLPVASQPTVSGHHILARISR